MNIFFLLITIVLLSIKSVTAAEMESPRFRIESGSIDFTVPDKPLEQPNQQNGNPEVEEFNSAGLLIKSDNRSIDSTPFRFSIGNSLLSFKEISPNNPSIVSSLISVNGGRTSYQLFVSEADQLKKLSGESIPDTTCSAREKCTSSIAAQWDSISSYGFGYSLSGQDIPEDFKNDTYFRPFANMKKNDQPVVIMKATDKSDERHATIILKTIVSAVQADGTYESVINFLAVPGY